MHINPKTYGEGYILAITIGEIYLGIKNIATQINNGTEPNTLKEEALIIAFIGRKAVLDRINKNNYNLEDEITIPQIDNSKNMTLEIALLHSLEQLLDFSKMIDEFDLINNILDKGDAYYELEKRLPKEFIKNIK